MSMSIESSMKSVSEGDDGFLLNIPAEISNFKQVEINMAKEKQ